MRGLRERIAFPPFAQKGAREGWGTRRLLPGLKTEGWATPPFEVRSSSTDQHPGFRVPITD